MAWQEPKTDWVANPKNPKAEDFNRIEGNIAQLMSDIETKKGAIIDAVNNIGGNTSIEKTHQEIADEINLLKLSGNASASDVLSGKTFYNTNPKTKVTGTIPSKGAATITPGRTNQTISSGQYLSGTQTITGDSKLLASNIKNGVSIFGVNGSVNPVPDRFVFKEYCNMHGGFQAGLTSLEQYAQYNFTNESIDVILTYTGSYNRTVLATTKNTHSMTGYSNIKVRCTGVVSNGTLILGVLPTKRTGDLGLGDRPSVFEVVNYFSNNGGVADSYSSSSNGEYLLDVSAISGDYYFYIGVVGKENRRTISATEIILI